MRMIKMIKKRSGFSLTEVLIAVLLLSIFTAAIVPTIDSAVNTYKKSLFMSESTILSDTIDSALTDILRYSTSEGDDKFTYEEFRGAYFSVSNGYLMFNTPSGKTTQTPLLGSSVYGKLRIDATNDENTSFKVSCTDNVFEIRYTLVQGELGFSKTFTTYIRTISRY